MKSVTIFCVFYLIHFVIGSLMFWECSMTDSSSITFNCSCSNNCTEIIYNPDGIVCDSINASYKQIQHIHLNKCNLSQINSLEIEKFKSLQEICISNSDIKEIDIELFNEDIDVKKIVINHNNITSIGNNAFEHFKNLTYLSLTNNSIGIIDNKTFANLMKLKHLDLQWNNLSTNNLEFLKHLNFFSLKELKITENKFDSFINSTDDKQLPNAFGC